MCLQGFPLWRGAPSATAAIMQTHLSFLAGADRALLPAFEFAGGALTLEAVVAFAESQQPTQVVALREGATSGTRIALLRGGSADNFALAFELSTPNTNGACEGTAATCVWRLSSTRTAATPDRAVHVVVTVATATGDARMYTDGSLVAAATLAVLPPFDVSAAVVGGCSDGSAGCQQGAAVGRVRAHNAVLPQDAIKSLFQQVVSRPTHEQLLFAFDFNDGVGITLHGHNTNGASSSSSSSGGGDGVPLAAAQLEGYPLWSSQAVQQQARVMGAQHMAFNAPVDTTPLLPLPTLQLDQHVTIQIALRLSAGASSNERVFSLRTAAGEETSIDLVRNPAAGGRVYLQVSTAGSAYVARQRAPHFFLSGGGGGERGDGVCVCRCDKLAGA